MLLIVSIAFVFFVCYKKHKAHFFVMSNLKTLAFATCIAGFSLLGNVLSANPAKAGYCSCKLQGYDNQGYAMYFCCNDNGYCFYHRGNNYPLNC